MNVMNNHNHNNFVVIDIFLMTILW